MSGSKVEDEDDGMLGFLLEQDAHGAIRALLQSLFEALDSAGAVAQPFAAAALPATEGMEGEVDTFDEFLLYLGAQPAAAAGAAAPPADAVEAVRAFIDAGPAGQPELLATAQGLLAGLRHGDWLPILQAAILADPAAPAPLYDPTGIAG